MESTIIKENTQSQHSEIKICPACSGRGFLLSARFRRMPVCHVCRGVGTMPKAVRDAQRLYNDYHQGDVNAVLISISSLSQAVPSYVEWE